MTALEQPALFNLAPVLTDRQQLVYDAVRRADPEGLTANEAGAILHARRLQVDGRRGHPAGDRCRYCAQEGRSVLRSKALKDLVKRKRGGGYVPRNPERASSQTDRIPF